jgi:hypothetical protein
MKTSSGTVSSFAVLLPLIAGTLACSPVALADPADQQYLSDLYQYVHPSVTDARLVELGHQVCSVRRNGGSTDDAKVAVYNSLQKQQVISSNAEMGSLVHSAISTLCPEAGYP